MSIRITLPGEPQGKERPRFGHGRIYTPAKTRAYETALALAAKVAMRHRAPLKGPLYVELNAVFAVPSSWPSHRCEVALAGEVKPIGKPDVDNILKMIDGLAGIVFVNDAQIVQAFVQKRYGESPMLSIEVGSALTA